MTAEAYVHSRPGTEMARTPVPATRELRSLRRVHGLGVLSVVVALALDRVARGGLVELLPLLSDEAQGLLDPVRLPLMVDKVLRFVRRMKD